MDRTIGLLLTGFFVLANSSQQSVAQQQGAEVTLAYKLEKGKTYRYQSRADVQSVQTMMGNEVNITNATNSITHYTVENVDKDVNYTVVSAVDSMISTVRSPQRDTTMVNPGGIVGKRTRDVLSKYGKVISSSQVDTIRSGMGGVRRLAASSPFVDFGGKSVKVGETWTHTRKDSSEQMGGKTFVTSNLTFTLVGTVDTLGHSCYKITYKGTIAIEGTGKMMGMNMFTEGTGSVSGVGYFGVKEGLLVASQSTSQQELTAAVTGQQNMTIPISQSVKASIVLVK